MKNTNQNNKNNNKDNNDHDDDLDSYSKPWFKNLWLRDEIK